MLRVDTLPVPVLGQPDSNESDVVSAIHQPKGSFRLRNSRGLLAVLVAISYLLLGALHGLHDLDVTNPAGQSEIASLLGHGEHADQKALAGHHCHGCFSVAVAQPAQSAALRELVAAPEPVRQPGIAGENPDTDSPPPKHLT